MLRVNPRGVDAPRPQQRRVQDVYPVRCHQHLRGRRAGSVYLVAISTYLKLTDCRRLPQQKYSQGRILPARVPTLNIWLELPILN